MKTLSLFLAFTLICISGVIGQQTVGLFVNDSSSFNGYTLFSPSNAKSTYLIDNCGREINSWQHNTSPGLSAYFLEDGTLMRAGRIISLFNGGGLGGLIEKIDWNNNILWSFPYYSSTFHQHHDFSILPNGNILVLSWELIPDSVALAAGRDSASLTMGLWSEKVVELQPIGIDSALVVWEWHLLDHVIQNIDAGKNNYGIIFNHPELIDLNYLGSPIANADWVHANALDYNPTLDQILINSRNFSEFWIIDHSTTSSQAAGHTGGNSGKGGDILYRWGNPFAYQRGTIANKKLFNQHDAHWIDAGLPDEGKIMVFNNGAGRPQGNYSTVEIISPTIDTNGFYFVPPVLPFGPSSASWVYQAPVPLSFYSSFISGAQKLLNGNVLICEGDDGRFFEVDTNSNILWEYINPVEINGPLMQGNTPTKNDVFRAYRYSPSFPGFNGLTLVPGNPIEINPLPSICSIYTNDESYHFNPDAVNIYMDVVNRQLNVKNEQKEKVELYFYDIHGKQLALVSLNGFESKHIPFNYKAGIYVCQIKDKNKHLISIKKIIQN